MNEALALAAEAAAADEVPIGAVVVDSDGNVIGRGRNTREGADDPLGHAELHAIAEAARAVGDWRLVGTTMIVTLEPCAMCAGALVNARVRRVVWAADDPKAGGMSSVYAIGVDGKLNHTIICEAGTLADRSTALLQAFFGARRGANRS